MNTKLDTRYVFRNPVQQLRWFLFVKIVNTFKYFAPKSFKLVYAWLGSKHASQYVLIQVVVMLENICSFRYSKIKERLHYLLWGFSISLLLVLFNIKGIISLPNLFKKKQVNGYQRLCFCIKARFYFVCQ